MALFDKNPDDAVQAGIQMLETLKKYNRERVKLDWVPITVGIGINTGKMMLGTIGEPRRMEGTVISDAVNLASRIEGITKLYGSPLVISEHTVKQFVNPEPFLIRAIDRVRVKGKQNPVTVFEVFNSDAPETVERKIAMSGKFDEALTLYTDNDLNDALMLFKECSAKCPDDKVAKIYIERCNSHMVNRLPEDWDGISALDFK
ncbi:MAG: adenylate/guanylate cyclase domain-containing protein [Proteobacteria bacterium]|nr:adenylate/guanylate cyclase domain-containing protein [Pseudomonadota bacterium]